MQHPPRHPVWPRFLATAASLFAARAIHAQPLTLTPFHASGIYELRETVGWTATLPAGTTAPAGGYNFTIRKNNAVLLQSGHLDPAAGAATIATKLDEPAMLCVEVTSPAGENTRSVAAAAVAPTRLQPSAPRPADFDAFWEAKIKQLHALPAAPVVTPGESDTPGVEYATVRLNNLNGAHVYGQLAKPAREGKFPAVLILQWAGGPYPLQKSWVTERAAEGWLALNIEPHDVPGDLPPAFYAALPAMIKGYNTIGNTDRDRNYFLQMFLGDYRALDYLARRPDWDGRTLLVMGTSMGGMQSLAVAGLHPRVTHLIVHVPAGADSNGALHGRGSGYPNWDASDPKVMETALYFDTVNFAPHIKATCLVSMGFLDTVAPPVGIWIAYNQIPGPKEVIPLVNAPHNHQATPGQQAAYTTRSKEWFDALAKGTEPKLQP